MASTRFQFVHVTDPAGEADAQIHVRLVHPRGRGSSGCRSGSVVGQSTKAIGWLSP
ncbi:hypothetical protein [Couchioplanes caeruleus]|uniref:hypothetical protein n=1 Tax=Couchioplanes caeruleus TaxID=56438 RepID=UPI000A8D653B|nr:hypothetical protein [Couchioplanes caeruleus]